jgi:hypothetical protein
MDTKVFQRALQAFTKRRPFKPFVIELASGDRLLVKHPEAVYTSGELIIITEPSRRGRLFQSSSVCQLLDVPAVPAS